MSASTLVLEDPRCTLIEAHQGPASCLLSSSESQSSGSSWLEGTDSDDDVRLIERGLVAFEVRKGKVA